MMLNNIAVLIDGDNASAKQIDVVIQTIEKLGKIGIKKIYGDWGQVGLSGWQEAILRHAIDPMQQFAYVKGKNATDIALVIEAMDLLHSGLYDGFCLVSSDSDFASLAVRIRKSGLKAYGFGRKEAVQSFRQACDEFFEVESLTATKKTTQQVSAWDGKKLKGDTKLLNALNNIIAAQADLNDENWSDYREVLIQFGKKHPDLNHENYGYEKLIHLIKATELFFIRNDKDNPAKLYVKAKTPFKYSAKQLATDKNLLKAIDAGIEHGKDKNGWCNLGQVSSYMNQNFDIDIKKYGYKKFSDLITAIRLFDIKKEQNGVYIKQKDTKIQTPKPVSDTALQNNTFTNASLITGQIEILVHTPNQADVVLWRLGDNKKVRHDGDMIFYGQTHSADGLIGLETNEIFTAFSCKLVNDDSVRHIILTASSETGSICCTRPLYVVIEQSGKKIFESQCVLDDNDAKSVMFLEFHNQGTNWKIVERHQMIKNDLRGLCQALGVEISDE